MHRVGDCPDVFEYVVDSVCPLIFLSTGDPEKAVLAEDEGMDKIETAIVEKEDFTRPDVGTHLSGVAVFIGPFPL